MTASASNLIEAFKSGTTEDGGTNMFRVMLAIVSVLAAPGIWRPSF